MLLTNKTPVTLEILGKELKPNESQIVTENRFNKVIVKSELGICIISTELGKHHFTNNGSIVASEEETENKHGCKSIIISSLQ